MSEKVFKQEEIALTLCGLYEKYGYLPYKMSKFEEYDLYAKYKEFLGSSRIVTFNDVDGKLLALKPDITLSIVKNDTDGGAKRKVYYKENVYRVSKNANGFKELLQTGLECIGDLDLYDVYETVYLAAASLAAVSKNFVLDISHLGVLSAVLKETCDEAEFEKAALCALSEKNPHALKALCENYGVAAEKLLVLMQAYGEPNKALAQVESVCESNAAKSALTQLKALCALLEQTEYAENIRLDFSVVNSGKYYDDILFKGFVDGIGEGVLSGGRYDKLLTRMGKKSGAIGFAVYLDLLEGLTKTRRTEDVDALVLYGDNTPLEKVIQTVNALVKEGCTVSAQKTQKGVRCKKVVDITGEKTC